MAGAGAPAQLSRQSIASSCAGCHAAQSQEQAQTPMGSAMQPAGSDPLLKTHPDLTFHKGPYTYQVETKAGQTVYSVTDGIRTITFPIQWSFGYGAQTWLLEKDGESYESLVSYYPSIDGLEITTGDQLIEPHNLDEAFGRKLKKAELTGCFGCHSTSGLSEGKVNLERMEPGVKCAHCHTASTTHMIAALQGEGYETAPPQLRKLPAEDISNFCGQCHRAWETVVRSSWRGEIDVRFQPYRLANSKCFDGTDPRISCIACHDPHRNLVTEDSSYDKKCLACHASKNESASVSTQTAGDIVASDGHAKDGKAKACIVANTDCVSCHMPKVKLPNGLVTFHDHEIRIVKPGVPYPD
jgi:hypothetical protein